MTIVKGLTLSKILYGVSSLIFRLQTEKNCNFLSFCRILMIFLPKCRPFYVVLEKGYGNEKKGMTLEKRGMAQRNAKTG